ncbi:MAG: penicillin acylase family protein, partial [Actinocatenispora sp.]
RTFDRYAEGVDAFAATDDLPPEYAAADLAFEPWSPVDSLVGFKIRHVAMGVWQYKVARASLVARAGIDGFDLLDPRPRAGMRVTVPPAGRLGDDDPRRDLVEAARRDVEESAEHLGFLSEVEAGSNAWVLGPDRTGTGAPLLVNDSHRALDVPNAYWQAHLSCAEFTVTGATFPGLPGFPHFGHNGTVGWAITNASADAQDLYVEEFEHTHSGSTVRTADGQVPAAPRVETIAVRGGPPHREECWLTGNGPVVHGDPRSGHALSLRWAATDGPCRQYGVLAGMLIAGGVTELLDGQRDWVDPVNNLLVADVDGHIGYLLRGSLPDRASTAATQLPVPGWEPRHHWRGRVDHDRMPRLTDPADGLIVSANNTVTLDEYPFVSHAANDYYRVERIHELAAARDRHSYDDMLAWQADVTSVPARRWAELLGRRGPYTGDAEAARTDIAAGRGDLGPDGGHGLVHACFRRALLRRLLDDTLGAELAGWLLTSPLPGCPVLLRRWFALLTWPDRDDGELPADRISDDVLSDSLARASADAREHRAGQPGAGWGAVHRTGAHHTLYPLVGDRFDPPSVGIGGDNETIQNGAYGWRRGTPFTITNLSVYRQVLDLADLSRSGWVVPGGVSGRPDDPHYADQLPVWVAHRLLPMHP